MVILLAGIHWSLFSQTDLQYIIHPFLLHLLTLYFCRSSVDSSAPSILPPRVWVSSTRSLLFSFIVKFLLYLSCEKNENKHGIAHLKTNLFAIYNWGLVTGLVVMVEDSWSRGPWVRILKLDTIWLIFHIFCCRTDFLFEKTEFGWKRGQGRNILLTQV